jgi:hypothetical protein
MSGRAAVGMHFYEFEFRGSLPGLDAEFGWEMRELGEGRERGGTGDRCCRP